MRNKPWLLVLFMFLSPIISYAQKSDSISGNFDGYSFSKFVEEVERQTDYRFYYRMEWVDSLVIRAGAYPADLPVVLARILEGTSLKFAVAPDKKVYITKERSITTVLATGFFPEEASKSSFSMPPDFDLSAYEYDGPKSKAASGKLTTIGSASYAGPDPVILNGYILSSVSGEPVIGASVLAEGMSSDGTMSDGSGYYWIKLPRGRHALRIQSIGMKAAVYNLIVLGPGKLNIEMDETVIPLKEIVVEAERDARVRSVQMGVEKLDIKTMKQMPSVLGEVDVLKIMLTLPGVQSVGEGASGLNVRGGSTNQNLILYNDAVVYNPSHLFGFFSVFNPDILKSVELYKSGITADYGGRLSSVLDISSREGNYKKFNVTGGISPITGRLAVEGPIIQDKTSFLVGIRSTYSDWLLRQLKSRQLKNSKASFYDLNFNVNHKVDDQNSLFLSAYSSRDHFSLNSDTLYAYTDQNTSLKWKHIFGNKLFGTLTGAYSRYRYEVSSDENPLDAFALSFRVSQFNVKADVDYFPTARHAIHAGVQLTRYGLAPGDLQAVGRESLMIPGHLQHEQGLETAIYAGDQFDVTSWLSVYGGIRYAIYQYMGPGDVFSYAETVSRSENSITDTTSFSKGKAIAVYHGAEPRFSARFLITKITSFKVSYTRMRQYIQMLSNTVAIAPTDTWKLSDTYIRPQVADQYAAGVYQNVNPGIELSVEVYYKKMTNALDFKDGAVVLMNNHIETELLNTNGKAYGFEFMIRKAAGKLNGWISYAYSRSFLQTKAGLPGDRINNGKYYPSSYDKPHAVNFIGNYKVSRRFNFSINSVYSTGRPITVPVAKYEQNGQLYLYYSDRNEFRIPNYFRTDISVNVEGNHKVRKLAHSSWTFAVYNLTSRSNAYSVYFVADGDRIKALKLSVFAKPIPTITYNFKF